MRVERIGVIFLIMIFGMLADLLLIEHFETFWQLIPVIFLSIAGLGYFALKRGVAQSFFRLWMYLGMLSGLVGIFMHVKNNWEFAIELHTDLKGWKLISEVATGAIPIISPGFLIPIAMLGLYAGSKSKIKTQLTNNKISQ